MVKRISLFVLRLRQKPSSSSFSASDHNPPPRLHSPATITTRTASSSFFSASDQLLCSKTVKRIIDRGRPFGENLSFLICVSSTEALWAAVELSGHSCSELSGHSPYLRRLRTVLSSHEGFCSQGFDVTVLENGSLDDVGIHGYWFPYRNIFSLVDELEIKPFTNWTKFAQYSAEGLEVEFPVFRDLPQLPTPSGTLYYLQVYIICSPSCVPFLIPVEKLAAFW
ncbi:hypothetical protein RchiOBHm_Chr6g0255791 [Rosa chinensis]|uniref:Uncharacterized protein n=1 Tax=Rosa chinensis TaxID=74649 RepID=A0A2P6PLX8_ROSCH|nr:hypothetical protein RchiOBHm_Chr6g0255791 [Rosa chinensis]